VATKEHRRLAKGLIEELESRVHVGPPIQHTEIHSARQFLQQNDFSPASDYFSRLTDLQYRLQSRPKPVGPPLGKNNYGGSAAGYWMQLQSAYDHVILSTCFEGEYNLRRGRIKISHRFNQAGRLDFVELKFLRSLQPSLNGEIRKLLAVSNFQTIRKDWLAADAYVLPVLPQELIFLFKDIFRFPRSEFLAWLANIGHGLVEDLLGELLQAPPNGELACARSETGQLPMAAVRHDAVAMGVLRNACRLQTRVEIKDAKTVVMHYLTKLAAPKCAGVAEAAVAA